PFRRRRRERDAVTASVIQAAAGASSGPASASRQRGSHRQEAETMTVAVEAPPCAEWSIAKGIPLDVEPATLLEAARQGNRAAWDALVARFNGLVWSIARGYRLGDADAHDAVQMTWLRLVENLDRIADPERLAAWLATTARRECLQLLRKARRNRID